MLKYLLTYWLSNFLTDYWLANWPTDWLTHPLSHSVTHSFTHHTSKFTMQTNMEVWFSHFQIGWCIPRSHLCMWLSVNSLRQKKVATARHHVYNLRIICVEAACISDRLDWSQAAHSDRCDIAKFQSLHWNLLRWFPAFFVAKLHSDISPKGRRQTRNFSW